MASRPQVYENLLLQMFETFVAKDFLLSRSIEDMFQAASKIWFEGPTVEDVEV